MGNKVGKDEVKSKSKKQIQDEIENNFWINFYENQAEEQSKRNFDVECNVALILTSLTSPTFLREQLVYDETLKIFKAKRTIEKRSPKPKPNILRKRNLKLSFDTLDDEIQNLE